MPIFDDHFPLQKQTKKVIKTKWNYPFWVVYVQWLEFSRMFAISGGKTFCFWECVEVGIKENGGGDEFNYDIFDLL
jgi:hypothetical protein